MATNRQIITMALSELGPAGTAAHLGLSTRWVYRLLARYRDEGEAAFTPRSKRPHTSPTATTPALMEAICDLRTLLTTRGDDAGADTIAYWLTHQGLTPPSRATIHRILATAGLITPAPKKRPHASYTRFEAAQPNELWQADFTHVRLADGTDCEVLDILDDHSRYLLHLHARRRVTATTVLTDFHTTTTTHGTPAALLTDNGLVFTARYARGGGDNAKNALEKYLHTHHIRQINGRPGHPQTQGKIERFHQTLKRWLAAHPSPTTITDLNTLLNQFRDHYNHHRPHKALGQRTPHTAYTALPKASPGNPPQPDVRTREDTVCDNGKVTLRYAGKLRHLGVGRAHKHHKVRILVINTHAIVALKKTGEIIGEYTLDPTKDYHPKQPQAHHQRTHTKK